MMLAYNGRGLHLGTLRAIQLGVSLTLPFPIFYLFTLRTFQLTSTNF